MEAEKKVIAEGGRRLAMIKSDSIEDWYVAWSPRNDSDCAEGNWEEWVKLAKEIIELNKRKGVPQSHSSFKPVEELK